MPGFVEKAEMQRQQHIDLFSRLRAVPRPGDVRFYCSLHEVTHAD